VKVYPEPNIEKMIIFVSKQLFGINFVLIIPSLITHNFFHQFSV